MSNYYDAIDVADQVSESLADPHNGDTLEPCSYCGEMFDLDAEKDARVRNYRAYCSLTCADNSEKGN